ncbi:hypothetical protein AMJ85_02850, partial [candidate division BRC1 bacterium SM23_51]
IPPRERSGHPGFRRLLEEIAQFYAERRDEVVEAAEQLTTRLRQVCDIEPRSRADTELSRNLLAVAFRRMSSAFDGEHGGFGPAPKFPQPTALALLLRYHNATGEPHALTIVETTLQRMACGGIYDQLGGGFHRYSTDARWLIPHFEKMLNDNALLARVYLDAYRLTGKPLYERVVRETLDYVLREMTDSEGGFYSSQDADSRGVEGAYSLWTSEEIRAAVGAQNADVVLRHFGVEPIGNFEGAQSVLSLAATAEEIARQLGRDVGAVEAAIAEGRKALFALRQERIAPAIDDKIVAAPNGLLVSAMASAAAVLGEERYLGAARRCADFLLSHMRREDGGLWRSYRQGKCSHNGYLPDYAFVIGALLDLYEACFEVRWLETANALAQTMISRFWDEREGAFFYADDDHKPLVVRPKDSYDAPDPSGNAAAVLVLLRLAELGGREAWREKAVVTLRVFAPTMVKAPIHAAHMLSALGFHTAPPRLVAIAGASGEPATDVLVRAAQRPFAPNTVLALADTTDAEALERTRDLAPALEGKTTTNGRPTAYVCQGRTCGPPTSDPDDLVRQIEGHRPVQ